MVTISARSWDGVESRPHHFMRRCAQAGWQVVFVEPPASLASPLKRPGMVVRWLKWITGPRSGGHNVILLAPPPILPFGNRWRWINRLNQRLIGSTVNMVLRKLGTAPADVYSFLPGSIDLLPHLRYDRLVYDCVDDHAAFSGLIDPELVEDMEAELMKRADVCFASARRLFERKRRRTSRLHLVPNGCEYQRFAPAAHAGALPVPPELEPLICTPKDVVVGFIGGIGEWVDLDLLVQVTELRPHLRFVLIGPVTTKLGALVRRPNVHFLGPKPYRDLPDYLQHFSACLIPFRLDELTASVNPIKLYEYLAAGKPVVSTPLPEVLLHRHVVMIASGPEHFATAIDEAIASAEDADAARVRQAFAAHHSWDMRWACVHELIESASRCS